jgi:glyoxylase-like metal-dependent hydrolase (beta-lactamase superfamily II)
MTRQFPHVTGPEPPPSARRPLALLIVSLAFSACGTMSAKEAPATQLRPLDALLDVAAYPNAETVVVLSTLQQLLASHREWQGYDYFGRLAREQPDRRTFFLGLQAVLQARVAGQIPLLKRVAWVEDAIGKLDRAAAADALLGRYARGSVFAELPERFGKTRVAIDDLEACLSRRTEFPVNLDRAIYRGLAVAHRRLGDAARSRDMLARSGLTALEGDDAPLVFSDVSVDPRRGFRFGEQRLVREADGVYVAEGYDFGNLAFIVGHDAIVAIDAGTTESSARDAVAALRTVSRAPIKYLILTHGHWDHVGGIAAVREPGTTVIAQANFAATLARSRETRPPFRSFFGTGGDKTLDATPDRLIAAAETLSIAGIELALIPGKSGETDDALYVHDVRHDILFVGDAFMPYNGAPFVAEGSAEGYLGAIAQVLELHPRRLVHGHSPLTAFFTIEAMPGLQAAFRSLHDRSLEAAHAARPLAELLHDNFVPPSLREAPKAALPYLVARDTFVQRLYAEHAGYWQANGEGMENFTRAEWALALDELGARTEDSFVRAADRLEERGDSAVALRVAELGLVRYPNSAALVSSRSRSLTTLRQINSATNPFRFIVYSEWAGKSLAPVSPQ